MEYLQIDDQPSVLEPVFSGTDVTSLTLTLSVASSETLISDLNIVSWELSSPPENIPLRVTTSGYDATILKPEQTNFYSFHWNRKESLYITGIKNLRKKINFIRLNNEFQNDEISDDEFEAEIDNNPEKYIVNVETLKKESDLLILQEIVEKIAEDLTIDEVSEIFSIDITTRSIEKKIEK
jgi:hypothetical protein